MDRKREYWTTDYIYVHIYLFIYIYTHTHAQPISAAAHSKAWVWGPLACWDCCFESRRGRGSVSLVCVVYCQVEVLVKVWSLVQRSLTDCGVSKCDRAASIITRPWHTRDCRDMENIYKYKVCMDIHIQTLTIPKLCCNSPLSEQLFWCMTLTVFIPFLRKIS